MTNETELQPILNRPDLPAIAETINATLEAERRARDEFRRELTPSVKAEFIAGEIVMHSPAKAKHLRATKRLMKLLDSYVERQALGEVFSEKALVCLTRNDYEPDIVFFAREKSDQFSADQVNFPAPDFAVEVLSERTEARDRGVKFDDYADHGVREYWIIDPDEQSVEQYVLRENEQSYHLAQKLKTGNIGSIVVAGFEIPVAAIFGDNENAKALRALLD